MFATVAFAESWMYSRLGVFGSYLAWTALFILLGGGVLGSLVIGRWRLPKERLPLADALIAAAARERGACLVHRDRHMAAIPASLVEQIDLSTEPAS